MRTLSVLWFLIRFRLRTKGKDCQIGLSALRQLYLIHHRPFIKCDEDALIGPFKRFLRHKIEDEDLVFFINPSNTIPNPPNSQESKEALEKYDLIVQ